MLRGGLHQGEHSGDFVSYPLETRKDRLNRNKQDHRGLWVFMVPDIR